MISRKINRRQVIGRSSLALLGMISGFGFKSPKDSFLAGNSNAQDLPFRISLNTSTIRAYKLPVDAQIDAVADAGFDGIELWVGDVQNFISQGGTAESIRERLMSRNLILENMIGFSQWMSDDANTREQAKAQLEQDMVMIAELGGKYIAAPVQGIKSLDKSRFDDYAKRYLDILSLSEQTGVVPVLELWGHGPVSQLADGANIVIATGHPNATMLLDFYHLYRGGNSWETLDYINCAKLPVIHINDFPGGMPRDKLSDADRIFPGDGICPFDELIPKLYQAGFRGGFSVELFNQDYWNTMDVQTILQTGYEKTLHVLRDAIAGIS